MPSTRPFGLELVDNPIPDSTDALKRGENWRELVNQAPSDTDFTPEERRLLLRISLEVRQLAAQALRASILDASGQRLYLDRSSLMLRPETPEVVKPTDQEAEEYGGVRKLQHASTDDVEAVSHDKGTLEAKLRALHTDARAEVDENITALRELVQDYAEAIGSDRHRACQALEEVIALVGRTAVLMRRQNPHDRDGKKDAVKLLVGATREMLDAEIGRIQRDLPDEAARQRFATEARATLGLFMGDQANRSPV